MGRKKKKETVAEEQIQASLPVEDAQTEPNNPELVENVQQEL